MHKLLYALCAMTAASCAWLLLRGYLATRFRLLLWSGLCFVGLTANNMILILDRLVFLDVDLSIWRLGATMIAMLLLLYGLIVDSAS